MLHTLSFSFRRGAALAVCAWCMTWAALAQKQGQERIDSLLQVLATAPPDSNRLRTLNRAGSIVMERGDLDRAIALYSEFTELARKLGDTRAEGIGLQQLGTANYYLGRAPVAMSFWDQSMALRKALADSSGIYDLRINMANGMVSMDDLEQGLRTFFEVLAWAERNGKREYQSPCLANIAMVYAMQGKLEDAARYYRRLLVEFKSELDPMDRSIALGNLGQVQLDMGRPDPARITFTELKELAEAGGMIPALANAELGLGNVAQLAGDRIGARAHFERSRRGYAAEEMAIELAIIQERIASLDREAVDSLDHAYLERFFHGATKPALAEAHALLDSAITTFLVNEDTPNLMSAYSAISDVERAGRSSRCLGAPQALQSMERYALQCRARQEAHGNGHDLCIREEGGRRESRAGEEGPAPAPGAQRHRGRVGVIAPLPGRGVAAAQQDQHGPRAQR